MIKSFWSDALNCSFSRRTNPLSLYFKLKGVRMPVIAYLSIGRGTSLGGLLIHKLWELHGKWIVETCFERGQVKCLIRLIILHV